MAQIYLTYRITGTEEEIVSCKVEKIEQLAEKLEAGLELVRKSCEEKFPDLCVEWDAIDLECVDHEEYESGVWDALCCMQVRTTSPDGIPELDFEVDEIDRWQKMGEPLYKDVAEYLRDADWSLIAPLCNKGEEETGEIVSVEFDVLNAVHNYRGDGLHFYNNASWL